MEGWSRVRELYGRNRVLVRFYLLFAYLVTLLYLGLHLEMTHELLAESFPGFIASCVAAVLDLLGQDAESFGQTVTVRGGVSFRVIYHCSGLFLMSIFTAAVLAYPARIREKLLGLALGLPTLSAANILRLALLGIVGKYYPSYFDLSHEYLWQGIFIVLVLVLWVQWRNRCVSDPGPLVLGA